MTQIKSKKEQIKDYVRDRVEKHRMVEETLYSLNGGKRRKCSMIFSKYGLCSKFESDERTVRRCFSELRKEGIILLPQQTGSACASLYILYMEGVNDELLESYLRTRLASVATEYFNDIVTLTKQLNYNKMASMIEPLKLFTEKVEQLQKQSFEMDERD